uniref:Serine/arginine repetitive matrix 4 n=1 Tax=Nothobranchius furzeri TaxID=105023 RepID=A0A8C6M9A4_NOTFU
GAGKLREKQLFEKFWKGTFKAVATPRPESVIVASITARRRVAESPSPSLSPARKKKKKKKKSSKKSRRHRYFSISDHSSGKIRFCSTQAGFLNCGSFFVCLQILPLKPGSKRLNGGGSRDLSGHVEGPRDYDSGNDTSSPPSSKTGVSAPENKRGLCQRRASLPVKQTLSYKDSSSDSGNSVTSYASSCKPYEEDINTLTCFLSSEQMTLGCQVEVVRSPKRRSRSSGRRLKSHSSSSSRSRSSGSFRHSGRYSRSPSLYSSANSCSLATNKNKAAPTLLLIHFSHCHVCFFRLPDRKRPPSSRQTDKKRRHKARGKRQRRKSYSPMKKRRRDSPSHLEARRITRCCLLILLVFSFCTEKAAGFTLLTPHTDTPCVDVENGFVWFISCLKVH